MLTKFHRPLRAALATVALGAIVPLAACNDATPTQSAVSLPNLPATLPLALGEERPIAYAPAVAELPRPSRAVRAVRIAEPDDYYAYAEDAWSYYDALGEAPPDYGFYYDGVEPWAWQAYDDSLMFVEPLDAGYRYFYYRPGEEYPYFVRDPDYGYGYDDGALAVIYDALGAILPYDRYDDGPWLDYASRYYDRGYQLYSASGSRRPVLAATWYDLQPSYDLAYVDWGQDLWAQPAWLDYHQRTYDVRERYWEQERARREAEAIRYAAWQDSGFAVAPPPRAIPAGWNRAAWAQDERWYAPAYSGFTGDDRDRQRAALRERDRVAALARETRDQDLAQLAVLREAVARRSTIAPQRTERARELRRQLDARQLQLARAERPGRNQQAFVERQQRALARAEGRNVRADEMQARRAERDQRLQRVARQDDRELRQIQTREQRASREQDRRQIRAQQQDGTRQQAREVVEQRRASREQARQQRSQVQEQARSQANARNAQREQARQAAQQQRAAREQVRQQRSQAQEQARSQANARNAQREQARQAAQQQRAAREQARQQRSQAQEQARSQANARSAQREQARQAAQQQRASREQARQQRSQAQEQARAQANARSVQREQARQAAQQQQASRDQARQAAQQQRQQARQQQQQQQQQQQRADAAQPSNGNGNRGNGRDR